MKSQNIIRALAAGIALPCGLLLAGCNDHTATTEGTTTSAVDTNAAATNADNSANNRQDRNGQGLTADDQGTSDSDRQITRRIRQMLMNNTNDFSMAAKNVKIITDNGTVTLRGPVNTDNEKTGIETIAKNVAGDGHVNDQLEVKSTQ